MGNKLTIIVQWINLAVFVWKKNKLCQMRKLTVEMTEHAKNVQKWFKGKQADHQKSFVIEAVLK